MRVDVLRLESVHGVRIRCDLSAWAVVLGRRLWLTAVDVSDSWPLDIAWPPTACLLTCGIRWGLALVPGSARKYDARKIP